MTGLLPGGSSGARAEGARQACRPRRAPCRAAAVAPEAALRRTAALPRDSLPHIPMRRLRGPMGGEGGSSRRRALSPSSPPRSQGALAAAAAAAAMPVAPSCRQRLQRAALLTTQQQEQAPRLAARRYWLRTPRRTHTHRPTRRRRRRRSSTAAPMRQSAAGTGVAAGAAGELLQSYRSCRPPALSVARLPDQQGRLSSAWRGSTQASSTGQLSCHGLSRQERL